MSIYHDELRRRLMTGKLQETARWYVEVLADGKVEREDMSPLERNFWDYVCKKYEEWRKSRPLN